MLDAAHERAEVALSTLKGADYNPRTITRGELDALKASIREYGFVQPVVARKEDLLVIGGHQRVRARKEMAKEDKQPLADILVPAVLLVGVSDERAKMLNLALNKIGGEWDYDALALVFDSLASNGVESLAITGFAEQEIRDVLDGLPDVTAMLDSPTALAKDPDKSLAHKKALARTVTLPFPNDADFACVLALLTPHGATKDTKTWLAALTALARPAPAASK